MSQLPGQESFFEPERIDPPEAGEEGMANVEQRVMETGRRPFGAPHIKVLGVGGGGCNAVNRMYNERVPGVEYYGVNTDALHLSRCEMPNRIYIGQALTKGLGVGGDPELGRKAAEESREELAEAVQGADMVFIAAGMGGGTGTGASPIIAELAREAGALTVAVVSRPFSFEVARRWRNAEEGILRLREVVDTIIVIPNNQLLHISEQSAGGLSWDGALKLADSVLQQGIQAIAEVVTVPGEINVDFADVKAILEGAGSAWLSIGLGSGDDRAVTAAQSAINSPLLDMAIEGVRRILFVVTGGATMTLKELQQSADVIHDIADPDANIIFGTVRDPNLEDDIKVTLVAADFPVHEAGESPEAELPLEEAYEPGLEPPAPSPQPEEADVPTFLRRPQRPRGRGFFR